jgi:hypothetical protein
MKTKEYDLLLTKELISMKDDLEKRIEKLIFDYNGIVDRLNTRIASLEKGCSFFSVIGETDIVDYS